MRHDAEPRVRLLGRPAVRDDDGRWLEFPSGQRGAALGYLAFAQRWVARDELVALFWPDRTESTARGNLRPLLTRVARDPLASGLQRERTRLRWPVQSDHAAVMAAQRDRRWDDAWRLVRGELLEGVTVSRAPEFESWLEIERASVREVVRTAGLHVADAALAAGANDDAGEVLSALQRLDPLDEAVLRRLMLALARRGARGEALAAYGAFVERCRDELDAEPEAATADLAEAVRSGRLGTASEHLPELIPAVQRAAPARLPMPLTPLVGRRRETAEVVARLLDPACRLLTLVGPGGIGKTRLALEAARNAAPHFTEGARAVDLTAVSSDEALLAALAEAVGARLDAGGDTSRSIVQTLATRDLLLVLDNVEDFDGTPRLVSDLLHGAPTLRVLATSREALGLAVEWRHDVAGLAHGAEDGARVDQPRRVQGRRDAAGTSGRSEAAALFVATGRRTAPNIDHGAGEAAVIERIVARLEGSPLAIELAAAWLRILDVEEIDDELTHGIDLLASDAADRPARHASMRQVLDQSWSMLRPREQAAMRRIAAFRGGFGLDAARHVADLELPTLLALVNKSFLRRRSDGRFSCHPLIGHHALERAHAQAVEFDETSARHARYYLRRLADRQSADAESDGGRTMREIEVDFENVVAAWRWAVAQADHERLLEAVVGMVMFCSFHGLAELLEDLLREALAVVPSRGALRGMLRAGMGWADVWTGRGDHGVGRLREGVQMVEGLVDAEHWTWVLSGLGLALAHQGAREEAVSVLGRAAAIYRRLGDVDSELAMRFNLAKLAVTATEARRLLRSLEGYVRARETSMGVAAVLDAIALHERLLGEFGSAERAARDSRTYEDSGEQATYMGWSSRIGLALVYLERGRLMRAQAVACRTVQRHSHPDAPERWGDVAARAAAVVGRVALVRRDLGAAEAWSRRALAGHRRAHGPEAGFDLVLETLARAALAAGQHATAAAWLDTVSPETTAHGLGAEARRIACRCCEAEVALHRGEIDATRRVLHEALGDATRAELVTAALGVLVSAARLFRVVGADERARSLLRYVRDHPRATFETRSAAALEHDGDDRDLIGASAASDDGVDGVAGIAATVMAALRE